MEHAILLMRPTIHGPKDVTTNPNTTIPMIDFGVKENVVLIFGLVIAALFIGLSLGCLCREVFVCLMRHQNYANENVLNEPTEMEEMRRIANVDIDGSINDASDLQEIANDERVNEIVDELNENVTAPVDKLDICRMRRSLTWPLITISSSTTRSRRYTDSFNGHTTIRTPTEM